MQDLINKLLENIPCLRRYARALTGNNRLADRIVQQCLDCAVDLQQLVKEDHSNRAAQKIWLFSIFHHIYNEFINEQQAIVEQLTDNIPDAETFAFHPQSNLEHDEYQVALMQLPLLQQQIFLLVSVEKFLYEEVSQIVNMPLGAVLSLLHTARNAIAEKVYSDSGQPIVDKAKGSDDINRTQIPERKDGAFEDHLEEML
jgi:RNA polymerase sigma-70 factor (ECF subfamily)